MLLPLLLAPLAWGVRTVPLDADTWRVRWEGAAEVVLDGHSVRASGQLDVDARRPHTLQIGAVRFELAARPADPCAPLRFAVLGDGRAAVDGVGPSAYWRGILGEALATGPAFVVNTGDLVKRGRDVAEWRNYLASVPPWPPLISVRGNHDRGPHFEALGLGRPFFAWEVGPALLVGLDSEVSEPRFAELVDRLDGALAASDAPWKLVFLHRPIWSRGNHGSDERGFNRLLVPVFERHDVAVVFSGHDHDYERFCPQRGLGDARRCVEDGPVYVVTGGAATFTNPVPGVSRKVDPAVATRDAELSRAFSGAKHFLRVEIHRGRLEVEAVATRAGNVRPPGVLDRFVRTRPDPPACRRRPDAGVP